MNFTFQIKGKSFDTNKQVLTGEEILKIADLVPVADFQLLLRIDEKTFEPIQLDEEVDLSKPGKERFNVIRLKEVKIFVNDDKYEFKDTFLTPREIVEIVEKEPDKYYLKQILGHDSIDYKMDMDNPIQIKNGMKFITNLIGPTPVS